MRGVSPEDEKRLQWEEFAERKALTEYGNPLVYMILSAY